MICPGDIIHTARSFTGNKRWFVVLALTYVTKCLPSHNLDRPNQFAVISQNSRSFGVKLYKNIPAITSKRPHLIAIQSLQRREAREKTSSAVTRFVPGSE